MSEPESKEINILRCLDDCNGSSLLFFFLILVCIFGKYDCGVSQDTLLLFFLLLVVLMRDYDIC